MADIEDMAENKTKINDDVDKVADEQPQQATIESAITEETIGKERQNDTITNIHTFVFDILAFFSNVQPSLIVEYCQETKNELVLFSMNFDQQNLDLMINLETILFSYLPSIEKADEWDKLNLFDEKTAQVKSNLIYQTKRTADFFLTIHQSFVDCIQLQKVPMRLRHDTQEIINPNTLLRFIQDTELVQQAEETIIEWMKEINSFYRKRTLVRQLSSDSGPLDEIKYWREQVVQLNHIMNQLRLPSNRAVIYLLNIAASARSLEWREIDKKLTQSINEARDHYKFLMIVAKHIGPLYRNDPREIQETLNSLLNTIVLINSCSEFYSKPEKIASLLVSISNQMVICCKDYLTNEHTIDIRTLDRDELLKRIDYIQSLHQTYRDLFLKTKQKIENHYLNKTNDYLSESHLLGQFSFLSQRLSRLREIIESFEIYSLLSKSRMDGFEQITSVYNKIRAEFLTFKFNLFDPNDTQFDLFYSQLNHTLCDIDQKLYQILDKDLHRILHSPSHHSFNALKLLARYENLHIKFFDSTEFLIDIIQWYEKEELEKVKIIYNQCRTTPPIERDHPPIIGRLLWARRMYQRIRMAYVEFIKRVELKDNLIMKKITENFLMIANEFSIYELLYHRNWYNTLSDVVNLMCNPLLVRQNLIRQLYINYDPFIDVVLRECELLARYSIAMPDLGYKLLLDRTRIRFYYERLKKLLKDFSILMAKAHPTSYELVEKVMTQVDSTLSIGLNNLNWLSKNLDELFLPAEEKISLMSDFLSQISSLIIHRIEEPINEVSRFEILEFPDDSIDFKQFVHDIQQEIISKAEKLNSLSMQIESAVLHVIRMFFDKAGYRSKPFEQKLGDIDLMQLSTMQRLTIQMFVQDTTKSVRKTRNPTQFILPPSNEWERFNELCNEFLSSFEARLIEALTLCAKNTFEMIKIRANPTLIQMKPRLKKLRLYSLDTVDANIDRKDNRKHPLISTHIELHSSMIILNPSIDEIQQLMHHLVNYVLNIFHGVRKWGEVRHVDSKLIHNYPMHDFSDLLPTNGTLEIDKIPDENEENSRYIQQAKTYYNTIANNKELTKLYQNIGTFFVENRIRFEKELEEYYEFRDLWEMNKINQAKKFILSNPAYASVRSIFADFDDTRDSIKRISESKDVDPLRYLTTKLKSNLLDEIRQLELIFAKYIRIHYRMKFLSINDFFKKTEPRLNRQLRDLDDVRFVINALDTLKENFVSVDHTIEPLEEVYNLFKRYSIDIPQEEQMAVEMLRSTHERLLKRAKHVTHDLANAQQSFLDRFLIDKKQFQDDVADFVGDYDHNGPMIEGLPAQEASDRLTNFESRFNDLWKRYETFVAGEELFGLDKTEYIHLQTIKKQLNYLKRLYGLYNDVIKTMEIYYETNWKDFHIEQVTNEMQEFQSKMKKLPKGLKNWPAYSELKKKLDNFNECLPLLELLINPAMQSRHWERIEKLAKIEIPHNDSTIFSLKHVMNVPLIKYREDVEDISITAQKERDIESKLLSIESEWRQREFKFASLKNRGELLLRGQETSEILSAIDDSNLILAALASNRYNTFFKTQLQKYIADLAISAEILTKWMQVQNLWIYLEAVFVGGDIGKQMPQEARRFANVDKTWIKLMSKAKENPNVLSCCTTDETLFPLLNNMLEQLELCQKSLAGYLEAKRGVFPRFYFLSDPVMLEILGQASDPTKIQPYLSSFTEAVKFVEFHTKETDRILSMITRDDEKIPLYKDVIAKGQVEEWLNDFIRTHQKTVHQYIRRSIDKMTYDDFDLYKFIEQEIAQLGLLIIQIVWTKRSEKTLQEATNNKNLMNETNKYFLDMLNQFIDKTTYDLTKYQRLKYETLITIHLHQRDIFHELYQTGIRSDLDFDWAKQCRFYFREDEDLLVVKITDVTFPYDNEVLGCPDRLVITPLTDRCYISIAQALAMSYGASPAGPAGTGKTETTKDMARTLGKYCIVQNCSDQFDYRGLGKTFKGLAISGCWGCFDEFNRINLPVLSVAAQQIQCLLQAKRERRKEFHFTDGDKITSNDTFAIIITMNPGYAGRQELPENLKINFRSIGKWNSFGNFLLHILFLVSIAAMMVPDRQIIMRVKLASGGFLGNTNLAQKFFTLYKCCEDQLSKQVHYDYGLRNITAVLRTLGTVKRTRSKDPEDTIVMRVLRDMNLSKLIDEDEPLFLSLLEDLFPDIKLDKERYEDLQKAIQKKVDEDGLINFNDWNLKIIQLYETQRVRHGIMVLGPSGAGKTKCCQVLMGALTTLGTHTRDYRMNPKSITASQMFGILDVATNDWTDGIFSTLWRRTLKAYEVSSKSGIQEAWWIILDGPVDAIWIENLNSVLDDNKLLTLANGDRIQMAPNVKLIFEVHNIDNASPATVSRCGMIFMSSTVLPWRPIFQAWMNKQIKNIGIYIFETVEKHFDELFKLLITKCSPKMKVYECNYIKQTIDLLDGLLSKEIEYTKVYLERLTVFSLMWSMGALLELNDRTKIEQYFINRNDTDTPNNILQGDSIFDYLVNDDGQWEHWSTHVESWQYPKDEKIDFASILVPNIDNVRISYLIKILSKQEKSVLLIGEPGTAKTVIITSYLKHYDSEQHLTRIINFSSITTSSLIQKTIENFVDKRVANTFGPSFGRKMTIFIDDINMPMINSWGDQEANEILRQLVEQKGFYSLTKPGDFLNIIDLQFLAAMCHPGGGRNDISERLKRHFFILNCTLPSNNAVDHIFGSIGKYFCLERNFSNDIIEIVQKSISATRILWQTAKGKFLPTPAKFHYVFNLRDLSRIWEGILQIDYEQCQNGVEQYLQLWKHECTRVLADRLIVSMEKEWFRKEQHRIAKQTFGDVYNISIEEDSEIYFANFLREELDVTDDMGDDIDLADLLPKIYEPISSWNVLETKLMSSMTKMNEEIRGSNMDLVFFKDAMIHLLRISRVINMPKGHLLLVGVGGSGKQSLTKLAAYIAGYKYFQISVSRTYTLNNFLDDLRNIYRRAARLGQGIVFVFTDNDIKDDQFLEYLNNVLSSGEVSGLITREEMDETLSELSVKMKKEYPKRALTNENLQNYYYERLRKNLHVVLCFSPDNRKFREHALKFPALVSGCTIDWFYRWPLDALVAVSNVYLNRFDILVTSNTIKRNVIELMADIHDDVSRICDNYYEKFRRRTYVTPKSFLSFINAFKLHYKKQREYFEKEKQKMKTGVQKLFEAAEQVQEITQELISKEKSMAIANTEAAKQVAEMEVLRSAAEIKTTEVQESKATAEILVKQVNEEKAMAEEELSAAEVILKEAEEAVKV
ncbi:unnamed protein product [Rotaria socialis]